MITDAAEGFKQWREGAKLIRFPKVVLKIGSLFSILHFISSKEAKIHPPFPSILFPRNAIYCILSQAKKQILFSLSIYANFPRTPTVYDQKARCPVQQEPSSLSQQDQKAKSLSQQEPSNDFQCNRTAGCVSTSKNYPLLVKSRSQLSTLLDGEQQLKSP